MSLWGVADLNNILRLQVRELHEKGEVCEMAHSLRRDSQLPVAVPSPAVYIAAVNTHCSVPQSC